MRSGGWWIGVWALSFCGWVAGGCVSLDEHRRLQAQHRSLTATKEALAQELLDVRMANDSLRARAGSLERELQTNNDLIANLRKENDLLEELRNTAQSALDEVAKRQSLGEVAISGAKLPEPLDSALKRFAEAHPSAVAYDSAKGKLKWKADLLFPLGSDVVKESSKESLGRFAEIMKSPAAADFEVIVVGHTDDRPIVKAETKAKHPTNWHLSAHRAISVALILRKFGYAPERISVMGMGEYRPVADNSTPAGSSQNRRVEIYIVPQGVFVQGTVGAIPRPDSEARGAGRAAP